MEADPCKSPVLSQRRRPVISGATNSDSVDKSLLELLDKQQTNALQTQERMMQLLEVMATTQAAAAATVSSHVTPGINTPTSSCITAPSIQFKLSNYDPDDTPYTITEWLDDVTRLKDEMSISDTWMVVKAGEALNGRAAQFFRHWRPIVRDWPSFRRDFEIAFPEQGTPATRAHTAITMRSRDFSRLTDYCNQKLCSIRRFYSSFPWNIVLSLVEHGIDDAEAQTTIRLQQPANDMELLKLLSVCDSRMAIKENLTRFNVMTNERSFRKRHGSMSSGRRKLFKDEFSGKCFRCGQSGHTRKECTAEKIGAPSHRNKTPTVYPNRDLENTRKINHMSSTSGLTCNHCGRIGHSESTCFRKLAGKQKTVKLVRYRRDNHGSLPIASISQGQSAAHFQCIIDTGADVSLLSKRVLERLHIIPSTNTTYIRGIGQSSTIETLGSCAVYVVLPHVNLEVDFLVVQDNVIGDNIDVLIGLDVIRRPGLQLIMNGDYADLIPSAHYAPRIRMLKTQSRVNINSSGLDERYQELLINMLKKYRSQTAPTVTTLKMNIQLADTQPVYHRARRLSYIERIRVKEQIRDLLENDIIRESSSPYASPIVLVTKRNGDLRLCIDYRELNKKIIKDRYPLPRIQDQIDALCKYKWFTTLDMKAGFYQVEIEEKDKHITAFVTPDGQYEFNRMPFGYANAPSIYQRAIDKALCNLKGDAAFIYLDDVLCPASSIEEGLAKLDLVLAALAKSGFLLNYEKCTYFEKRVEYLGFLIEDGSIRPCSRKTDALAKSPVPNDVHGVRQFLGLAGYFRRFIPGYASKVAPMTNLLRKNATFTWNPELENLRQDLIRGLSSQPTLSIYNPELPIELHTDASSIGLGAVLLQLKDMQKKPIAYFSRKTNECESRYHSYDLETLAIVEAVEYFHVYLYGRRFVVFTDCNSVRATAIKKQLNPRVARWWVRLQNYDFDIEYRPGRNMAHVDYLSRNPQPTAIRYIQKDPGNKTIHEMQEADSVCKQVKDRSLCASELKQYRVHDGLVYRLLPSGLKCYVPKSTRLSVLRKFHDESSHIGPGKMYAKMSEVLFWPRMKSSVQKYTDNCRICVVNKSHTGKKAGLGQLGMKPSDKNEVWHIDHAGPLVRSGGCTQILVIIDGFTKYCWFKPIAQKTTKHSIKALEKVFEKFKPKLIIADRGTAFSSAEFSRFLAENGVELHLIATGAPRGNGQVERVMRTLFNLMRCVLTAEKEKTWTSVIQQVQDDVNATISTVTGVTPNLLMYGYDTPLESTKVLLTNVNRPSIDATKLTPIVRERLAKQQKRNIENMNKRRKSANSYSVGNKVVVRDSQLAGQGKLGIKFKGPYKIVEILPNDRYRITKGAGTRFIVAAGNDLRMWPCKGHKVA